MRIAIVGAGGVGGYFGGVLAQAGHDVTLLARGDHLAAIKANGLKVETSDGQVIAPPIKAIGLIENTDPYELVIVAVKGWQLDDAIPQIHKLSDKDSIILPLLNGIDATDVLQAGLLDRQVIFGLCGIIAAIKEPGVIKHIAVDPFITFGIDGESNVPQQSLEKIKAVLDASGVKAEISDDIQLSLWRKFLFICPLSAVTSVSRATIGEVRSVPETRELLCQCIDEVISVGQAGQVGLNDEHREDVLDMIDSALEEGTTSMQRDVMSSRPSELETQLGAVIRLGRTYGVSTTALSFIYSALLPQELAVRGKHTK